MWLKYILFTFISFTQLLYAEEVYMSEAELKVQNIRLINQITDAHFNAWKKKDAKTMFKYFFVENYTEKDFIRDSKEDFKRAYPDKLLKSYSPSFSKDNQHAIKIIKVKPKKKSLKDIQKQNYHWLTYFFEKINHKWKIVFIAVNWDIPNFKENNTFKEYLLMEKIRKKTKRWLKYLKENDNKNLYLCHTQPKILDFAEWLKSDNKKIIDIISSKNFNQHYVSFPEFKNIYSKKEILVRIYFGEKTLILTFTQGFKKVWGIDKIKESDELLDIERMKSYILKYENKFNEIIKNNYVYDLLMNIHQDIRNDERYRKSFFGLQYLFTNQYPNTLKVIKYSKFQVVAMKRVKSLYIIKTKGLSYKTKKYALIFDYIPNKNNNLRIKDFTIEEIK